MFGELAIGLWIAVLGLGGLLGWLALGLALAWWAGWPLGMVAVCLAWGLLAPAAGAALVLLAQARGWE